MRIIDLNGYVTNNTEEKCVLALGNFDGVHKGHKRLFESAKCLAIKNSCKVGIYTFDVNTKQYFGADDYFCLTTDSEKNDIFKELGAHFICYDNFADIKDLSPEEFCRYLKDKLGVCAVVCGENFRFGKNACASADLLSDIMKNLGVGCKTVPLEYVDGECVSSTAVRRHILNGNVDKAEKMLGYRYFIKTEVSHGARLGTVLGFPTANQLVYGNKAVPKFGVYACVCEVENQRYMAVTNVGVKPTVTDGKENPPIVFESHIIGYSGDAYGKVLPVYFCRMLREEKKFASLDELKNSVFADTDRVKALFASGEIAL